MAAVAAQQAQQAAAALQDKIWAHAAGCPDAGGMDWLDSYVHALSTATALPPQVIANDLAVRGLADLHVSPSVAVAYANVGGWAAGGDGGGGLGIAPAGGLPGQALTQALLQYAMDLMGGAAGGGARHDVAHAAAAGSHSHGHGYLPMGGGGAQLQAPGAAGGLLPGSFPLAAAPAAAAGGAGASRGGAQWSTSRHVTFRYTLPQAMAVARHAALIQARSQCQCSLLNALHDAASGAAVACQVVLSGSDAQIAAAQRMIASLLQAEGLN